MYGARFEVTAVMGWGRVSLSLSLCVSLCVFVVLLEAFSVQPGGSGGPVSLVEKTGGRQECGRSCGDDGFL